MSNLPKIIFDPKSRFRCSACKSELYKFCRTCPECEQNEQKPNSTICLVCRDCDLELEKLNAATGDESTTEKHFLETNTEWVKYVPLERETLIQHFKEKHNKDIMQESHQVSPSSTSSPTTPPTNAPTLVNSTATTTTKQETPVLENKFKNIPPLIPMPSMPSTTFKPIPIVGLNQTPQSIPTLASMNTVHTLPMNPKITVLPSKTMPVASPSIPTLRNLMIPQVPMMHPFSYGPPVRPTMPLSMIAKHNPVNTVNMIPTNPSTSNSSSPKNSNNPNHPTITFMPKIPHMDSVMMQNSLAEHSQKIIQNAEIFVRKSEQLLVQAKLKEKADDLISKVKANEITVPEFFESFQSIRRDLNVPQSFAPMHMYSGSSSVLLSKHANTTNVVKAAQAQQAKEILRQTAIQALTKAKASNTPLETQTTTTAPPPPAKSPVKLLNPAIAKQFLIRITKEKIANENDPTVRIELKNHPKAVEDLLKQFAVCNTPEEQAELLSKNSLLPLIVENLYKYIVNNKLDQSLKKNEFSKIKQEEEDATMFPQKQDNAQQFEAMEDEEEEHTEQKPIKQEHSKQPIVLYEEDDEYGFGMNEIEVSDTKSTIPVVPDWQTSSSSSSSTSDLESALLSLSNLAAAAEEQEQSSSSSKQYKETKTVNTRKREKRDTTIASVESARKRTRSIALKEQEGQKNPLLMLTNIATQMLEDVEKCK